MRSFDMDIMSSIVPAGMGIDYQCEVEKWKMEWSCNGRDIPNDGIKCSKEKSSRAGLLFKFIYRSLICLESGVFPDLGPYLFGPFDEDGLFFLGEFGVFMRPGIRVEGHFMFFNSLYHFFHFVVGAFVGVGGEVGEIEVAFAVFDMAGEPPGNGLNIAVPGVSGVIGMAVVTSLVEDGFYLGGYRVFSTDIIR